MRDPSPILEYARHIYDVIIIDTNGVYSEWNLTAARMANELLLVTTNGLPALASGTQISLDITSVPGAANTLPGRDLTVTIRL